MELKQSERWEQMQREQAAMNGMGRTIVLRDVHSGDVERVRRADSERFREEVGFAAQSVGVTFERAAEMLADGRELSDGMFARKAV